MRKPHCEHTVSALPLLAAEERSAGWLHGCFGLVLELMQQDGPSGIAFAVIAARSRPAGMCKLDQRPAIACIRERERRFLANGLPRSFDTPPGDTPGVRLDDLPAKHCPVRVFQAPFSLVS